jgi:hypothetical protein
MKLALLVQLTTSVVVPLLAVWLTLRAAAAQSARATRAAVNAQHLSALSADLASMSRDLRELLYAPDVCAGCGTRISARELIGAAEHVDRTIDLALVGVVDPELERRLHHVLDAAHEVRRHRKSLTVPCDELVVAAQRLAIVCDQMGELCMNVVLLGEPVRRPWVAMSVPARLMTWAAAAAGRVVPYGG